MRPIMINSATRVSTRMLLQLHGRPAESGGSKHHRCCWPLRCCCCQLALENLVGQVDLAWGSGFGKHAWAHIIHEEALQER